MRDAHGLVFGLALVLGLAAVLPGCSSRKKETGNPPVMESIRDFQVVWTRGGKLGYLKTYAVASATGPVVDIHYVEDLDFRRLGWVSDDGQGERYDYPPAAMGEAKRVIFERVLLPPGSVEDQVRRIFQVDPTTELAFQRASEGDLRR